MIGVRLWAGKPGSGSYWRLARRRARQRALAAAGHSPLIIARGAAAHPAEVRFAPEPISVAGDTIPQ